MSKSRKNFIQRVAIMMLALVLTSVSAWADNVNYFDPTAGMGQQTKTATNPTVINDGTTTLGTANTETWYYVSGTFTNGNRIEVLGTVNIILVDGCNFTASKGIRVESPNALNIWAQKAGDGCGRLTAYQEGKNAAIGSNGGPSAYGNGPDIAPNSYVETIPDAANAPDAGIITIYGGDITANGNIGGGDGGDGYDLGDRSGIGGKGGNGTIIIYDGHITVHNNLDGNLGGGNGGYGHGVPMYSGENDEYGDPIVLYYSDGQGGDGGTGIVTINGGYVNSEYMGGGNQGAGDEGVYGSFGAGNVSLSWSKASDMIIAQYIGTVHLVKSFMDMHEVVYEGDYEDCQKGADINNTLLYPYSTMYDITIGGSYDPACLQSNKTYSHAMVGAEITLTAINGYKVSSVTVKDTENQDVSLTDNLNGTWTFIMPAKAVTVTPVATRFYQVNSSSNISQNVTNANDKMVQNSKTYYRPGATVNFVVTVPDGYVIQSLTVKDEDDQNVSYSANGTNAYTFTMPTKAVTMEAVTMRDFSGLTLIEGTAAFTVTAGTDDGYGPFGPENLLDGKYSSTDDSNYSLWIVNYVYTGCYVEFNTPAPVIPKHYTLISAKIPEESPGCYPTSWTIKAKVSANDEWTTIADESDNYTMSDNQGCHSYLFDFDNPGNIAYKYFRFEVTDVPGYEVWSEFDSQHYYTLELSEMQMYVKGETLTTAINGSCGETSINNGDDVTWSYDTSTKVLTISGTGPMMYYGSALGADSKYHSTAPWSNYDDEIKKVVVGDGVTYIGSYAFAYCTALTSVSLPASVLALGNYVCYTSNVIRIDIPSTTAATLGEGVFGYCSADLQIAVPSTLLGTYQTATNWSTYASSLLGVLSETTGFGSGFSAGEYEYTRTFKCGVASTVCLPFNVTKAQAESLGKFYTFVGIDKSGANWEVIMEDAINKVTADYLNANTPYLFVPYIFDGKSQGDAVELTFSGNVDNALNASYVGWTEDPSTNSYWTFQGVYYNLAWEDGNENLGKIYGFAAHSYDGGSYNVNPGDFVKAGAGASIAPFRAYLQYTGSTGQNAPMRGGIRADESLPNSMRVLLINANGTITATGDINTVTGDVTIDTWSDINGRILPEAPVEAGMYIHNGKLVLINY